MPVTEESKRQKSSTGYDDDEPNSRFLKRTSHYLETLRWILIDTIPGRRLLPEILTGLKLKNPPQITFLPSAYHQDPAVKAIDFLVPAGSS